MKKFLAFVSVFLLLLPLLGCDSPSVDQPKVQTDVYLAGFGRQSITPQISVPLAGDGDSWERMCQGILDRIYVTCIALSDESAETVLLCSLDVLELPDAMVDRVRQAMAVASGVKPERILLCATNTHSGPDLSSDNANMETYREFFCSAAAQAAKAAMDDRAPADILLSTVETENMNFVNHYTREEADAWCPEYADVDATTLTGHTTQADNTLRLIRLTRKEKKDILLVNWQAPPDMATWDRDTRRLMSADYIGAARTYVEQSEDVQMAFFQGAAGNLSTRSRIKGETFTEDLTKFGQQLGKNIVAGIRNMQEAAGGTIATHKKLCVSAVDHTEDNLAENAESLVNFWQITGNEEACWELAKDLQLRSVAHAQSVLNRLNVGAQMEYDVDTVAIGDIAFAAVPWELFDSDGVALREASPYAMTFLLCDTNGNLGCLPSDESFAYGCHQVDVRWLERNAAQTLTDRLVNMLQSMKNP